MERPEVRAYLGLERAVAALEASGHDDMADRLRNYMDIVWLLLTGAEKEEINKRPPGDVPGYG